MMPDGQPVDSDSTSKLSGGQPELRPMEHNNNIDMWGCCNMDSVLVGFGHIYISVKMFSFHLAQHRELLGNGISDLWRVDLGNWQVD